MATETITTRPAKPLMLMDIDGVLNAFGAKKSDPQYRKFRAAGYLIMMHRDIRAWVRQLEENFEVVWATMWMENAGPEFGYMAGFGEDWEYIDFNAANERAGYEHSWIRTGGQVGIIKHAGILERVANRPAIWLDDDAHDAQVAWANARTEEGIPTMVLRPDPKEGLTQEHIDICLNFAKAVNPATV